MHASKLPSLFVVLLFLNGASSFVAPDHVTNHKAPSSPVLLRVATLTDVTETIPSDITYPTAIPTDDCLEESGDPIPIPIPVPPTKPKSRPTFDTWKRRLNTHEDTFNIHKWSGLLFALSSTTILGTGLINGIHNEIPAFLEPLDTILNLSILAQCVSSIEMADKHRRNQPEVRDQFKALAYGMVFAVLAAWLDGPFALDVLIDNKVLSDMLIAGFGAIAIGYPLKGIWDKEALIKARDNKFSKMKPRGENDTLEHFYIKGSFLVSSLITPLLYIGICVAFLHPEHDRAWMMQWQDDHAGQAATYYGQVYGNTVAMWSGFITTLRDKKLIGRDLESFITFLFLLQVPINSFLLVK